MKRWCDTPPLLDSANVKFWNSLGVEWFGETPEESDQIQEMGPFGDITYYICCELYYLLELHLFCITILKGKQQLKGTN